MTTRAPKRLSLLRLLALVALCYAFLLQGFFTHANAVSPDGETQLVLCHTDAADMPDPGDDNGLHSQCDLCLLPVAYAAVLPTLVFCLAAPIGEGKVSYASRAESNAIQPPGRAGHARAPPHFA